MILNFGRFKGKELRDVPEPYLRDLLKKFTNNPVPTLGCNVTVADLRRELERREGKGSKKTDER